eukprot:UC4_evm6s866
MYDCICPKFIGGTECQFGTVSASLLLIGPVAANNWKKVLDELLVDTSCGVSRLSHDINDDVTKSETLFNMQSKASGKIFFDTKSELTQDEISKAAKAVKDAITTSLKVAKPDVHVDFNLKPIEGFVPTKAPTFAPTMAPTSEPPTKAPTTATPTLTPTRPITQAVTLEPTSRVPTTQTPTQNPTKAPTEPPTKFTCVAGNFRCHTDNICLPCNWMRDGFEDCYDGSDELPNAECDEKQEVLDAQDGPTSEDIIAQERRGRSVKVDGKPGNYVAEYRVDSKGQIAKLDQKSFRSLIARRIKKGLGEIAKKIAKIQPKLDENVIFQTSVTMKSFCDLNETDVNELEVLIANPNMILKLNKKFKVKADVITNFFVNDVRIPDVTDRPTPLPSGAPTTVPTTATPSSAPTGTPTNTPTKTPTPIPLGCADNELECFAESLCLPCEWRWDGWSDCSDNSDEDPDKLCVGEYPDPTKSPTVSPTLRPTTISPSGAPTESPTAIPTTNSPTAEPTLEPVINHGATCPEKSMKSNFKQAKNICEEQGKIMCTMKMLEATCTLERTGLVEKCSLSDRFVWVSRDDMSFGDEDMLKCANNMAAVFTCNGQPKCKKKSGVSYAGRCCDDLSQTTTLAPTVVPTKSPTNLQSLCENGNFRCLENNLCIPCSWVGDGFKDCSDGNSDESTYAKLFCKQSTAAPSSVPTDPYATDPPTLEPTPLPTGICQDKQPSMCAKQTKIEMKCKNNNFAQECQLSCGICSPKSTLSPSTTKPFNDLFCPDDLFPCKIKSVCMPCMWTFDGNKDCPDGLDESSAVMEFCSDSGNINMGKCQENQFRCIEDGICIPCKWVGDGKMDCSDGSDEFDTSRELCFPTTTSKPTLTPTPSPTNCLDLCQPASSCQIPESAKCFQIPDECFDGEEYQKERCCDTSEKASGPDNCWYGKTDFSRMIQFTNCCLERGQCEYDAVDDGTPCDDGILASSLDVCQNGVCQGLFADESRIQFSSSNFLAMEKEKVAVITIKREGDVSKTSAIDLFTEPIDFTVFGCPTVDVPDESLCDYVSYPNSEQTNPIVFEIGESRKTIQIMIFDDNKHENVGSSKRGFRVRLSKPRDTSLGSTKSSFVEILDDEDLNLPTSMPTPSPSKSTDSPSKSPTTAPTNPFGYICSTDSRCAACNGESKCSICKNSLYSLDMVGCVEECPEHHYASGTECISNYECSMDSHCHTCASEHVCSNCKNRRYLISGGAVTGCYDMCPPSHVGEGTGNFFRVCKSLCSSISGCQRCDSKGNCAACKSGLYLIEGVCSETCPPSHLKSGTGETDRVCVLKPTASPTLPPTRPCTDEQFSCLTEKSGQFKCLPCMWANDGIVDCLNGFDETDSQSLRLSCPARFPDKISRNKKNKKKTNTEVDLAEQESSSPTCESFEASFYIPSTVTSDLAIIRGTLRECQIACCAQKECVAFSRDIRKKNHDKNTARCWLKSALPTKGRSSSSRYHTWVMT